MLPNEIQVAVYMHCSQTLQGLNAMRITCRALQHADPGPILGRAVMHPRHIYRLCAGT